MTTDLAIPEPCLVVLVGVAGAGKSTFAARHFAAGEILSSDGFRARVGRSEADQGASRRAFVALHAALERRMAAGRTTVVDATNVRADARRDLVRRAARAGIPAVAIVLDLPLADCLAGDLARVGRHVGRAVIERQWVTLQATIHGTAGGPAAGQPSPAPPAPTTTVRVPFAGEGFAAVHRFDSRAALDSVTLRRGTEGWPTLSDASRPRPRP